MRVARASLRVSLFGGGTDRPEYYEQEGSTIVSFALDRSIYVSVNDRPTGGCRLSYSQVEDIQGLVFAKHTLVAEAASYWGFPEPCTMTIVSDLPKGTGLGSSSALIVALREVSLRGSSSRVSPFGLEHHVSPEIGQQDFLPAIHGGLRKYTISTSGQVAAYEHRPERAELIDRHGVLLYTGMARRSAEVLTNWSVGKTDLHDLQDLAEDYADTEWTLHSLGEALEETWKIKSSIEGVCPYDLYEQYKVAKKAGALGGKLCGAGAGGCWFFITEDKKRLIERMRLAEISFQVAMEGHKVVEI